MLPIRANTNLEIPNEPTGLSNDELHKELHRIMLVRDSDCNICAQFILHFGQHIRSTHSVKFISHPQRESCAGTNPSSEESATELEERPVNNDTELIEPDERLQFQLSSESSTSGNQQESLSSQEKGNLTEIESWELDNSSDIDNEPSDSSVSEIVSNQRNEDWKLKKETRALVVLERLQMDMPSLKQVAETNLELQKTKPGRNRKAVLKNKSTLTKAFTKKQNKICFKREFQCKDCSKSFSLADSLQVHSRVHTGEKPYKCMICSKRFSHKCSLEYHMRTHTGKKPYKCGICQKSFSQSASLISHSKTHRVRQCLVCKLKFMDNASLVIHNRTHSRGKRFPCPTCKMSFLQKVHLIHHLRVHTGEKPFSCPSCQRTFSIKSNLKAHIRSHTGEKPFKCLICHKSFTTKTILVKHMSGHNGEKIFKCSKCFQ